MVLSCKPREEAVQYATAGQWDGKDLDEDERFKVGFAYEAKSSKIAGGSTCDGTLCAPLRWLFLDV